MYKDLEHGLATHDPWMPMTLLVFEFDPYRDEPRFKEFAKRFQL
jgi:hypothetical protein